MRTSQWAFLVVAVLLLGSAAAAAVNGKVSDNQRGTIAFASVGRAHFAYDVFGLALPDLFRANNKNRSSDDELLSAEELHEVRLTDGISVNYNGQLVEGTGRDAVLEHLRKQGVNVADDSGVLVFVSERDKSSRIYFSIFSKELPSTRRFESLLKLQHGESRSIIVVDAGLHSNGPVMFDRPFVLGQSVLFTSTKEPNESPRQSWAAVYSTNLKTLTTTRLTPKGTADFSPAVSPSGKWVAVASSASGFHGETLELLTDLYVYTAEDGSNRRLVRKHGGWPSWADDHTLFFHRQADDGWWSVFRLTWSERFLDKGEGEVQEERMTPPGMHAVTPAASPTGEWLAVSTRRPGSLFRHVEIFDLTSRTFVKLTEKISPHQSHYNPFISSHSDFVGYHRCRGHPVGGGGASVVPLLEEVSSPSPDLSLLRIDGTFPTFSPDGSRLAFVRNYEDSTVELPDSESGLFVSNADGSGQRKLLSGLVYSPSWSRNGEHVLYASYGPEFRFHESVQIISVHNVDGEGGEVYWKQLTTGGNNAFPSPSPDGRHLVFRSGRSGHRNLYIMDAVGGEEKEIRRLTEGPWIDQHSSWSPAGEWIAFSSDREKPGSGSFAIYMIHPNGTGLRKVIQSNYSGLAVHPVFSPDGQKLVFISDLAAVSGDPVAEPHMFQPYGEVFIAGVDGSNIERLTHNYFEDGTPTWGPSFLSSSDLSAEGQSLKCNVEDTRLFNSQIREADWEPPATNCPFSSVKSFK